MAWALESATGSNMTNDLIELPVIEGHQVSAHEWKIFQTLMDGNTPFQTCDLCGISTREFRKVRNSLWFKQLESELVREAADGFHKRLLKDSHKVAGHLIKVATGKITEEQAKYAGASVQAAKLVATMGRDPLVSNGPMIEINNTSNTQNNYAFDIKKLQDATAEEMIQIHQSGEIPAKFADQGDSDG
jgi:hypothetical protein